MKIIFFIRLIASILCATFITGAYAQYYKTTKRNILFLNTNSLFPTSENRIYSTIEAGKEVRRYYFHGGLGIHYSTHSFEKSQNDLNATQINPVCFYTIGGDVKVCSFRILDLSQKSYCKILGAAIRVGADLNKTANSVYIKEYSYRVKAYLEFYVSRAGSNKRDIGWHRAIQLGYSFSDLVVPENKHHSILLNVLIIKHHLLKFADWY